MTPQSIAALAKEITNGTKNPRTLAKYHETIRRYVPGWHAPMLGDRNRNQFYANIIRKHAAGKTVFEIGAGTGLLTLMAAAAGAKHVYACEVNPLFVSIAQKAIDGSEFKDRITLFAKPSLKVKLPEKVDIIVSEIISTDIFSEHMLPALQDARRFLKRGGLFLPSQMDVYACLATLNSSDSHGPLADAIVDHTQHLPRFVWASDSSFEVLSESKKIATVDGALLKKKGPWTVSLKRTKPSSSTFVCVYFVAKDGKDRLTNRRKQKGDPDSLLYANSWGEWMSPVSQADTYKVDVHLLDQTKLIVTEH